MTHIERVIIGVAVAALMSMIAWMIFWPRAAGAETTCQTAPLNKTSRWMWRDVDGKRCWYEGTKLLPKSELIWQHEEPARIEEEPAPAKGPDSSVRSGPRIENVKPLTGRGHSPGAIRGRAIDLMAPGELHGEDGAGDRLIIPPYNYSNPQ
jgi:hypothetical protein